MMGALKGNLPMHDVGFELGQAVGLNLLVGEMGAFCRSNTDHASHNPFSRVGPSSTKGTQ